ncbi:MAG: Ig-like domain-containing protein [Bacteroidota bacterium]
MNKILQTKGKNSLQMFHAFRNIIILLALLLGLSGFRGYSQGLSVITTRFANPVYDCTTGTWCVDVEFTSSQPNRRLVDMNVRFWYDSDMLTYQSVGGFATGYYLGGTPSVTTLTPASGPDLFTMTGAATYWNGYVTVNQAASPVLLSPGTWTKLFSMCFTLPYDKVAEATDECCPVLVWDLEEDPADGGFMPGSDGVVITLENLQNPILFDPAIENVVQFNWTYTTGSAGPFDPTDPEPYGYPVKNECIDYTPLQAFCPENVTLPACTSSADIAEDFTDWLASFRVEGGCDPQVTRSPASPVAPSACGGSVTVTWTVTEGGEAMAECSRTFTVSPAPAVSLTVPGNYTVEAACTSQTAVNAAFNTWLGQAGYTGGCNPVLSTQPANPAAPSACGGSITVQWTLKSDCAPDEVKSATFTVPPAPAVVLTIPANYTAQGICLSQTAINEAFSEWLTGVSYSGGCNATLTRSPVTPVAPSACGGSIAVTWTVKSDCAPDEVKSATFTVPNAPVVVLTVPANYTTPAACLSQSAIDDAFATWLAGVSYSGGCNATLTRSPATPAAPDDCGGTVTVTWTVKSDCAPDEVKSATFTVLSAPLVALTCPLPASEASGQTQDAINAKYATWLASVSYSGGCNAILTNNSTGAPSRLGGTATVTWTVTSDCQAPVTCSSTFTVSEAPLLILTCAPNQSVQPCLSQNAVNTAFAAWLASASYTGGCNPVMSMTPANPVAPDACGGSVTVTWNVTNDCGTPATCTATFTVPAAPAVTLNVPENHTVAETCLSQAAINTTFAAWLGQVNHTGGCNGVLTTVPATPVAPSACGGSVTVEWTLTTSCGAPVVRSATFTVPAATAAALEVPASLTLPETCLTQAAIDEAFGLWLDDVMVSGGCNVVLTTLPANPAAPDACGGSVTVEWTLSSSCSPAVVRTATFTVPAAPEVTLTCPDPAVEASGQSQAAIDEKYIAWLAKVTYSGGCNAEITHNSTGAPSHLGGSTTVMWTVTQDCGEPVSCSATFTVTDAPPLVFRCAGNMTVLACRTQDQVNAAFAIWLATTTYSGGCRPVMTTVPAVPAAPDACGGSVTVTWNVTNECGEGASCTATFTVPAPEEMVLEVPENYTVPTSCLSQQAINLAFEEWLGEVVWSGGCDTRLTISPASIEIPDACGGSVTVQWTLTGSCGAGVVKSATFTVPAAPALTLQCPQNASDPPGLTQEVINTRYQAWLQSATHSGGCNAVLTHDDPGAPSYRGGTTEVTWTLTDACNEPISCTATYSVGPGSPVILYCPDEHTEPACKTQEQINTAFAEWLASVRIVGGCDPGITITPENPVAPDACGGSVAVTWAVTNNCGEGAICTATFTVVPAERADLKIPENYTGTETCPTQAAVDAAFAAWLGEVTYTGGCNPLLTTSPSSPVAPSHCGGSATVEWTLSSICDDEIVKSATFTIPAAPPVAADDAATTPQSVPVNINILANDQDCCDRLVPGSVVLVAQPASGTVAINATTGAATYTPAAGFTGTAQFTYSVCNAAGLCDQAVVTVTVLRVNRPPVAVDDNVTTILNNPVSGNVLNNDTDPDGDPLTVITTLVTIPANGIVTISANGAFTYAPNTNFSGNDYFEYQVCDPGGLCDVGRVNVTVEGCELFIPEGFSPNSDGINDYFRMLCVKENYPNARIEIYNRWGNLLYEQDNYGNEDRWGSTEAWWDGRANTRWAVNREILPAGTYFYIFYKNDGSDPITGFVFLNR